MKSILILLVLAAFPADAGSLKCAVGIGRCIKSQDTEIPSKQVIKILENCRDFTAGDIGLQALQLSTVEIVKRANGKLTPLMYASAAFDELYDSAIVFDRKSSSAVVRYSGIKRSCQQLERDFNDETKWTK